jgi:hypothetical protein
MEPGSDVPEEMQAVSTYIKPQYRPPHDASICFEEYHHYAKITREKEESYEPPKLIWREFFSRKKEVGTSAVVAAPNSSENTFPTEKGTSELPHGLEITDQEWENASRLLRTAGTGACKHTN